MRIDTFPQAVSMVSKHRFPLEGHSVANNNQVWAARVSSSSAGNESSGATILDCLCIPQRHIIWAALAFFTDLFQNSFKCGSTAWAGKLAHCCDNPVQSISIFFRRILSEARTPDRSFSQRAVSSFSWERIVLIITTGLQAELEERSRTHWFGTCYYLFLSHRVLEFASSGTALYAVTWTTGTSRCPSLILRWV